MTKAKAPEPTPPGPSWTPNIVEVAPGVHAVLQPPARRFLDSNAVVVTDGDETLVVDGSQRRAATRWLADRFHLAEPDRRVHVVTTHWHLDHALASSFLVDLRPTEAPVVEVLGHADLARALSDESLGQAQLAERRLALADAVTTARNARETRRGPAGPLSDDELAELDALLSEREPERRTVDRLELVAPTHEIAAPATITIGTRTVELLPLRAHTDADLLVYLPDVHVLLSGDVVDEIPFGGHGHPRRWLEALRRLRARPIDVIVPGHGPLLGPDHIDRMITLWTAVLEQAAEAEAHGQSAETRWSIWAATDELGALRDACVTDAVSGRAFDAFLPAALARAMSDPD